MNESVQPKRTTITVVTIKQVDPTPKTIRTFTVQQTYSDQCPQQILPKVLYFRGNAIFSPRRNPMRQVRKKNLTAQYQIICQVTQYKHLEKSV